MANTKPVVEGIIERESFKVYIDSKLSMVFRRIEVWKVKVYRPQKGKAAFVFHFKNETEETVEVHGEELITKFIKLIEK